MDIPSVKALLNNISGFSVISFNSGVKSELVQSYCHTIDEILSPLKPVLDEIVDTEIVSNEDVNKVLEQLDVLINKARELVESWHQMMSKLYFVLQIEPVITKIQASVLKACQLYRSVFQSLNTNSGSASLENCVEKIRNIDYTQISDVIKEATRGKIENAIMNSKHLARIADSLSLLSNQELLMETVALEKLKTKVDCGENSRVVEYIDHMVSLIAHMHDYHVKVRQLHSINGVPIPADFCCPLSLELMSDPVIVASGQTYERAFIQKWLDEGFTVCPKTHQTLGHSNLIPNYTVKALIANWCETNNIKLPDPLKSLNLNKSSSFLAHDNSSCDHTTRSPETNISVASSQRNSLSSNGSNKEAHHSDKLSTPPDSHLASTSSPLHVANGVEVNLARMSLASSIGKGSNQGEKHAGSGGHIPNQLENECSDMNELFHGHNRTASASSADYNEGAGDANMVSQISSDLTHNSSDASGEVTQETPASSVPQREPEFPVEARSRGHMIWRRQCESFVPRIIPIPSTDPRPDLLGIETQIRKLIEDLGSDSLDLQRAATGELRLLAKHNMENRIVIANCGAISFLVSLLHSTDSKTQENAVTTLLNLSINENNKTAIANADAINPLIHVLETGKSEAKENAAATLFSLSVIEENKVRIGRSGAIKHLVELLGNGTPRGKKDAATALFNLSTFHENKLRIVQDGAVKHLVELMDPAAGMVDRAVAVLSNLSAIPEGRASIGHEAGIPVLVEVVELGSARAKENAAAALLQLCMNSNKFCSMVLQEGAVPPLVALLQSGTVRAKEKAQALLSHFRNQRHGNAGRA